MKDPQSTATKGLVDELLEKQDNVIGQLEKLEAEILAAVETLAAERKSEQAADEQLTGAPSLLPMSPADETASNDQTDDCSNAKAA